MAQPNPLNSKRECLLNFDAPLVTALALTIADHACMLFLVQSLSNAGDGSSLLDNGDLTGHRHADPAIQPTPVAAEVLDKNCRRSAENRGPE